MLEDVVRKAGKKRQRLGTGFAAADDRDRVEVRNPAITPRLCISLLNNLAASAEMGEDGQPARSPTKRGQEIGDNAWGIIVLRQDQEAPVRSEMQPQIVKGPPVQGDRRAIGERPTEPCGREAEGARLRHDRHLLALKMA